MGPVCSFERPRRAPSEILKSNKGGVSADIFGFPNLKISSPRFALDQTVNTDVRRNLQHREVQRRRSVRRATQQSSALNLFQANGPPIPEEQLMNIIY